MIVIKRLPREKINNNWQSFALFLCPYCNNIVKKRYHSTRKSCGCYTKKLLSKSNKIHGNTFNNSRLYRIWSGMQQRCYNGNHIAYKWYGGKDIIICNEWKDNYLNFKNWALNNGYKDNLTIDRIDSNGNYEPSNCQWITQKENLRKSNRKLTFKKANQIRSLYNNIKITQKLLSSIFNISVDTISDILNNKNYID